MMDFSGFIKIADELLGQLLEPLGFGKKGLAKYCLQQGALLVAIDVQQNSAEPLACVNIGVHYSFMAKLGCSDVPTNGEIEVPECEIKLRLSDDEHASDQWWPLSLNSLRSIVDVAKIRIPALVKAYQLPGDLLDINPEDFDASIPPLLSSTTRVRAIFILAVIHEKLGNGMRAVAFANAGLKFAGMAVGPKRAFKDILSRNASS